MAWVSARNITKSFGVKTLFADLSLTVGEDERIGLVGMNGTGKSTLLKVLAGIEACDSGTIERRRDGRIRYLAQEPQFAPGISARDAVREGLAEWMQTKREYDTVTAAIEAAAERDKLLADQARLLARLEALGGHSREHVVEDMLAKVGVTAFDRDVATMSGGERRRVALAALLVERPDLAILDEPTNHLDADTIEWLEEHLAKEHEGSVLLVTHDRYVLDALCTRIVELDRGKLHSYDGNYGDFLEQKAERLAQEERQESNRANVLRRETAWLRRGPKARTTKQKARIQRAEALLAVKVEKTPEAVKLEASAQRLGGTVLELDDVWLSLGGRTLIDGLTLHMAPGARIGIIGKNGAGKTSLLKLVTGELEPERGRVKRGQNTKIAYFDQARAALNDAWNVYDNVAEREGAIGTGGISVEVGAMTLPLRTYLERFSFDATQQRQPVGALSGGERARVALAKMLKTRANLLLLDEPTNDLDTVTLAALEEMLEGWPGCALIVSHDRYFLNRLATGLLVFEDGKVTEYVGNYETYRALRAESAPVGERPATATATETATATVGAKALTYAEKIELEGMMDRIALAEAEVAKIEAVLAEPDFYVKRFAEVKATQAALDDAKAKLEALVTRWESLEARRDAKK
ncbi:MAG: ABC-F family ATP-binding cassette domain-containing protein [Deltaproteobacteria bacterium]|nr:ABC-F family ATP-binding cassette domain-containing protein [Deltaproteobacteria bacterium]